MRLLRRTRETHRHERAVVLQQKADAVAAARPVNDWERQREIEDERRLAALHGRKAPQ
jgi:hypothetical protein